MCTVYGLYYISRLPWELNTCVCQAVNHATQSILQCNFISEVSDEKHGLIDSICEKVIEHIRKSNIAPVPFPTMYHSEPKYAYFWSELCVVGYEKGAVCDLFLLSYTLRSHSSRYFSMIMWKDGSV